MTISAIFRASVIAALAGTLGFAQDFILTRIAGAGPQLGDGGPGQKARFGAVAAVAAGPDGSIFIADPYEHMVRRVMPNGTIVTAAGNGLQGHAGDGGLATAARIDTPTALAVDRSGQIYIGESGSHYIRKVAYDGKISTIAGNGQAASAKIPIPSQAGVQATALPLNYPSGIAFLPNGDLVVSDSVVNDVVRISLQQGTMVRVAGGGSGTVNLNDQPALTAVLAGAQGVAADGLGNIYIVEQTSPMVRRVDASGTLSRVFGTGSNTTVTAAATDLNYRLIAPWAITVDSSGIFYVAELRRISKWDPVAHTGTWFAGDNSGTQAKGDGGPPLLAGMIPVALAIDAASSIYFADSNFNFDFKNRVRKIANNVVSSVAGGYLPNLRGDRGPATAAELYLPQRLAVGNKGELYIADNGQSRVRRVTPDGNMDTVAGNGQTSDSGDKGSATGARLYPTGVAVDRATGRLYIASGLLNGRVRVVDSNGIIDTIAGAGSDYVGNNVPAITSNLASPTSLAVDSKSNVYLSVLAGVRKISASTGNIQTVAGNNRVGNSGDGSPATSASIDDYPGINVDALGNLYIAGDDSQVIRKVGLDGIITTVAGGGVSTADGAKATATKLGGPLGVAVDSGGNMIIADTLGHQIKMVDAATGLMRTIAGGTAGFGVGEGGIATAAVMNSPNDVQIDSAGNILIVDTKNQAVYKLSPAPETPLSSITRIQNEASMQDGVAAIGERVLIGGTRVGPPSPVGVIVNPDGLISTTAGGFQIFFDEFAAPILAASSTNTLVQVPYEVAGRGSVQVTVAFNGANSPPFPLSLVDSAPAIYLTSAGQADSANNDGTANSMSNPAGSGSTMTFSVTGEGQTSPAGATGLPVNDPGPVPVQSISVQIGGMDAPLVAAVETTGTVGKLQVQVTVPTGLDPTQPSSLTITVGSGQSQDGVIAWAGDPPSAGTAKISQRAVPPWTNKPAPNRVRVPQLR